jgi:hypothetical protein
MLLYKLRVSVSWMLYKLSLDLTDVNRPTQYPPLDHQYGTLHGTYGTLQNVKGRYGLQCW